MFVLFIFFFTNFKNYLKYNQNLYELLIKEYDLVIQKNNVKVQEDIIYQDPKSILL